MTALFRFSLVALLVFALVVSLTPAASACPPGFAFRAAVDPGCGCGVNVPAPVAPLARFSYSAQVDPVPVLPRAQYYASGGGCNGANFGARFDPLVAPYANFGFRADVVDPYFRGRFFGPHFFGRHADFRGSFHGHVGHR